MKLSSLLLVGAAMLVATGAQAGSTVLYSDVSGKNLNGTVTPAVTTDPGNSISMSATFNPTSGRGGGVLINEKANNGYWQDSQLEIETDGTVRAAVWNYQGILTLGTAVFGQANVVSFSYDDTTGLLSGVLNGVTSSLLTAPGARQTPFASGQGNVYYGIGVGGSTNLGNGQSFVGSISNVTITGSSVPEPATWAMMILGMGAIGYAMRREKLTMRVSHAA